jgi:Aldehyde dehydrogenase family
MRVAEGDLPGPVLPVIAVRSDDEALSLADAAGPSVGASVWTADQATGVQISRELRADRTWINEHMLDALSPAGFDEFVAPRLRVWEPSRWRDLWWHPYDQQLAETARAAARYVYGRQKDRPRALREGALPAARLARRLVRDKLASR